MTAPGRQAENGDELVGVLADATGAPVVVLTGEDEGRLAWEGAVARMADPPEVVAVADLGGGSCELAVGTPALGPGLGALARRGRAARDERVYLGGNPPPRERVGARQGGAARAARSVRPPLPGRHARRRRDGPRDRPDRREALRRRRAREARPRSSTQVPAETRHRAARHDERAAPTRCSAARSCSTRSRAGWRPSSRSAAAACARARRSRSRTSAAALAS